MREEWRRDLILIFLTLVVAGVLYTLATGAGNRVAAAPAAGATMTPTAVVTAGGTAGARGEGIGDSGEEALATLAVGTRVDAPQPPEMDAREILDLAERLLDMTEAILERPELESQGPAAVTAVASGQEPVASGETAGARGQGPGARGETAGAVLSVWEDGGCWTPADARALHLCGADAGDGYVIRWIGVHGDSRGPEIPDADWLAARGGGDRVVWSGGHPATGEAVSVTYWSGGHVLAVHVAGRLEFRIDRAHRVQ